MFARTAKDHKKFDGQPFSSLLYAQLLRTSGVDSVITVHNHSVSVQRLFAREFQNCFFNLSPADLYAHYLLRNGVSGRGQGGEDLVICAPDDGAAPFVRHVYEALNRAAAPLLLKPKISVLLMSKTRSGERQVSMSAAVNSPTQLEELEGRDVVVFDDMVRTGSTVVECGRLLKLHGARRVVFVVTHFYSSDEVKENLNDKAIDEIVTTNTLPTILNRDMQGRLRRKMLVLKIEKWIVNFLYAELGAGSRRPYSPPYSIDMSAKNYRWRPPPGMSE